MPNQPDHHERRLHQTRSRLKDALERLRRGCPVHPLHQRGYTLTVTTLAREAGVARNAIYTNHREILEDLHMLAGAAGHSGTTRKDKIDELRGVICALQQDQRRLVSENALLLQRTLYAEAEAERHQRHNARLIAERDTALRAVPTVLLQRMTLSSDLDPGN